MEARPTSSPDRSRPGVLVTRPEPGAGESARRVADLGRTPVLAPALTIAPRALGPVGAVQAVLVTSSNALPALAGLPRALRLLAVGDATAERARAAGFAEVQSAGRDATALAALARDLCRPADGPLLLASGEGQGAALRRMLEEAGFAVEQRVAYAAEPAGALPADAAAALRAGQVGAALFFSPETARATVALLRAADLAGCVSEIEALALSPAVAEALAALPWRRIRVASHPSQDQLLALMSTQDPTDTAPSANAQAQGGPAPGAATGPAAAPVTTPVTAQQSERTSGVPVLVGIAFLVLLAATVWLAKRQIELSSQISAIATQASATQASAPQAPAADRLAALEAKLDELAARPAPAPAPASAPAPVDLSGIEARLAALESAKPAEGGAPSADLQAQVAALAAQVAALKHDEAAAIARATTAALLARAQAALDAGQPVGDIPGAPPALARYAKDKPPTEATLRLAFPAAAAAAEAASRPATQGLGMGERMWTRVRSLLTIRHGSEVVVGPPATETLGAAQTKLDAGDLAGAVAALQGLDAPAAQAMAGWTGEAQALLDARAALAAMAHG